MEPITITIGTISIGTALAVLRLFTNVGKYKEKVDKVEQKVWACDPKIQSIDVIENRLVHVEKRDDDIKEIYKKLDIVSEDTATIKATLMMMNSSKVEK